MSALFRLSNSTSMPNRPEPPAVLRITDADRVAWLAARVSYMEHSDNNGVICHKQPVGRGYWPLEEGQDGVDPDDVGITLIDYIDRQINLERKS